MIGPIAFIFSSVLFFYIVLSNTPKVLILHSYDEKYIWTNLLDNSLEVSLKKRRHIRNKVFYMNSKHHYNKATEFSTKKVINQYNPDIIVAFDDNAQKFLSEYYLNSKIKIVFAGVNGGVEKYGYIGNKNISGIFERKPVKGIKFVLSSLNQAQKIDHHNILLLGSKTRSFGQDVLFLKNQDWGKFNFSHHSVDTFAKWKAFILAIDPQKVHYLLLSSYRNLIDETSASHTVQHVNFKKVIEWTLENAKVPLLGVNIFSAQDGIPIAVGSSAYEQVETALSIVDEIIEQGLKKPINIAYKYPKFYSISINKTTIDKLKYNMPDFIESFAGSSHNIYK